MESGKTMLETVGESTKTRRQGIGMQGTGNRTENGGMVGKVP